MRRPILCLLLLLSVTSAQEAAIDEYCSRAARFGFSGSVLVAKDDKIVLRRGYGAARRDPRAANTERTLFEIASVTKPFTAAAILKLEQQGKLSIDDPIAKYLPGVPEAFRDITVHHLLTHTSGMPRMGPGGHGPDLETAVAQYLGGRRDRKAGESFEYWNGGYALLAGIVEVVTGGTYMDYCRKHLFAPAGMRRTGFTGDAGLDKADMACGYSGGQLVRPAGDHPYGSYGWQYRGMGGIVTSVVDLYRWDRALRGNTILNEAARKKHFTPFKSNYACGWYVTETARKTRKIFHGGDVRGFHTQFARFPDENACLIVMCNVDDVPTWAIAGRLEELLFGDEQKYPHPPAVAVLAPADLDAVAGTYELSKDSRLVVRRDEDRLRIDADGQRAVDLLQARLRFAPPAGQFAEETGRATELIERIGSGDLSLLRDILLEGIPPGWVDTVRTRIWPAHVKKWGKLKAVRPLGASFCGRDRIQVILALEHENGSARCRIVLQNGKLAILDLQGPRFAATATYLPTSKERFVRFAWVGPSPLPVCVERDGEGNVLALRFQATLGRSPRARRVR